MKKTAAATTPAKAGQDFDAKATLRAALKAANPALTEPELEQLVAQATGAVALRKPQSAPAATAARKLEVPKFSEHPRYALLEKAHFPNVKVQQGDEWVPMQDVLLDPEEMPFEQALKGPFGPRAGTPKRVALKVEYDGVPDDHLEPLNEAAEWMLEHVDELKAYFAANRPKGRGRRRDPVDNLVIVGYGAETLSPAKDAV